MALELVEHKERAGHEAAKRRKVVPMQFVAEVKRREDAKDGQRNDLLDHLQLVGRKGLRPDPVGRHLEAVLEEGDAPTHQDHLPQGHLAKLQVPIPREGHKDVRADKQQNGPHSRCVSWKELENRWRRNDKMQSDMSIADNLAHLHEQITEACRRAGRSENDVALMAVSKIHPVEMILEAYAGGQRLFGENRVQEFQEKSPRVKDLSEARFHLIGPLQSNKTSKAAELFDAIDAVDSLKIAQRLNTAAAGLGKKLPVLIEVKLSHEDSKHGLAPAELPGLLAAMDELESIEAVGLMTVPPWSEDAEAARPYFRELRRLRDESVGRFPRVTQLSMGMSNDFTVAIEEGSTCVRVGTALFGRRLLKSEAQ